MYLLTNVAKTQDVPLDGTIFFGNTGQKDKATFMKKIFLYSYPKLVETYRNQVLQHRLTIKNPDMIYLLTNVAKTQDVRWTVLFSSVIPAKRTRGGSRIFLRRGCTTK